MSRSPPRPACRCCGSASRIAGLSATHGLVPPQPGPRGVERPGGSWTTCSLADHHLPVRAGGAALGASPAPVHRAAERLPTVHRRAGRDAAAPLVSPFHEPDPVLLMLLAALRRRRAVGAARRWIVFAAVPWWRCCWHALAFLTLAGLLLDATLLHFADDRCRRRECAVVVVRRGFGGAGHRLPRKGHRRDRRRHAVVAAGLAWVSRRAAVSGSSP